MPRLSSILLPLSLVASPLIAQATRDTTPDQRAVRQAVLDYVEGFYEGDTTKLARALRPELTKFGFWKGQNDTAYGGESMSYEHAIAYAKNVRAANRPPRANAPKIVQVFDVLDQTASAKLTAWWGTDYLLLAKYGGRWQILHVLWQGPLPAR
jgi:hypothetical protein